MSVWLFNDDDFRTWLKERSGLIESREPGGRYARPGEAAREDSCASCHTQLGGSLFSVRDICGYCLAYQFGVDSQERLTANAVSRLLASVVNGSPDHNQLLLRHLLIQMNAAVPPGD